MGKYPVVNREWDGHTGDVSKPVIYLCILLNTKLHLSLCLQVRGISLFLKICYVFFKCDSNCCEAILAAGQSLTATVSSELSFEKC